MAQPKKTSWGFELSAIDTQVRPQDDLFMHVNGSWIANNPIPESESWWGSFKILRFETEKRVKSLVEGLASKKGFPAGSAEQLVGDFYRSGMDIQTRTELDASPLTPWLASIMTMKSRKDMHAQIAKLHTLGIGVLWGFEVDQDFKKSDQYMLHLHQDGLGMPDRDYYLKDDAESLRIRTAYISHIQRMFRLVGKTTKEAASNAETILRIETQLAAASMTKEDLRDPQKTYTKKSLTQLERHTPTLEWTTYLKRIGAGKLTEVNLMQPEFFTVVQEMFDSISLEDWKVYFSWHVMADFASFLSPAFVRERFMYAKALTGAPKQRVLWRQVLSVVDSSLEEVLGQLFVKKYFSPEAKQQANAIIDDLFTAYENRIKNLDWMTDATKRKALKKLHAMTRKIGYPDKWKSYKGLVINIDDYVGNVIRSTELEHTRNMKKLMRPVDQDEWFMSPQTVNAYYASLLNDIAFPAAFLQWPFFDPTADAAINYGSMGMSIGHEISHGFDDHGSQFDSVGNLKTWWTPEDRSRFEARAKKIKNQFDAYTVADGVHVNGQLTLGENIADLGGLSIAYDAYQLYLAREGREDIDGYTPEQRFFLGFAQGERDVARNEFLKTKVLTDPHSPAEFRVNGPASNLPEFYAAFNVKKGDKLYKDPKDHVKIW